jgi:hypothetical protein
LADPNAGPLSSRSRRGSTGRRRRLRRVGRRRKRAGGRRDDLHARDDSGHDDDRDRDGHEDGSGAEVEIDGTAFVLVDMEPASGFDFEVPEGELVYEGPRRLEGASVVREVVRTGDFEAQLAWAIGLDSRVDFRVSTLEKPARLVVDLRNH